MDFKVRFQKLCHLLKIVIRVRRERYAERVAIRWENPSGTGG